MIFAIQIDPQPKLAQVVKIPRNFHFFLFDQFYFRIGINEDVHQFGEVFMLNENQIFLL